MKLTIIGASGHGKVVADIAKQEVFIKYLCENNVSVFHYYDKDEFLDELRNS